MNHWPTGDPPGDLPGDEERLRRLLEQTVADVDPNDGLEAIRSRTKANDMPTDLSSKRPWIWGAFGAAVATAAVIGGFAVINNDDPSAKDPGFAGTQSVTPTTGPSGSSSPDSEPTGSNGGSVAKEFTVGVYYVGDTPQGPRLYREFHKSTGTTALDAALADATAVQPQDPDYRTDWPAGIVASSAFDGVGSDGLIQITLADASVHDRPAGMSKVEAQIAVEQLIYTAQAAMQARAPVQFFLGGNPIDQVFGVPTSEPLAQGKWDDVLSFMSVTAPEEGATVSGSFEASGVASSFEVNVQWQITHNGETVKTGFTSADGWMDKLYPWTAKVNVSDLAPGTYTFVAMTDEPSGGAEGNGPYTDSRTIVIQ
jgi:hypothetical protein